MPSPHERFKWVQQTSLVVPLWAAHSPGEGYSEGTSNSDPCEELLWFPTWLLTAFLTWLTLSSTQTILAGVIFPVKKWKMFREGKDRGEDKVPSEASDVSPPSDRSVSGFMQRPRAFAWGLSVEDFVLWDWGVIYSREKWQPTGHVIHYLRILASLSPQQHH